MTNDIAWAAGLFEGEGTITSRKNCYPGLAIVMTDKDVIEKFADVTGLKMTGPHPGQRNNNLETYSCQTSRITKVQDILRNFWPYLGERRRQRAALVFAQYYEAPIQRNLSKANTLAQY